MSFSTDKNLCFNKHGNPNQKKAFFVHSIKIN